MRISDVLRHKGADVVTVTPDISVRDLLGVLAEHRIGAAIVSADGTSIDGIVSERDVVRAIASHGTEIVGDPVTTIMTSEVHTCTPHMHVDELMPLMTEGRFRHMPVVVDGALKGIVSIGDVVKSRLTELEVERDSLTRYINASSS